MQVCRTYLKKFVKVTRICRSNMGMPNLCVYVKVIQVCQSYTGMTILNEYVKLVWVCQTEVGISNLYRNVMLIRVCHTYTGMSNFTGLTYFCILLSHLQESVKSRECQTFNLKAYITEMLNMSHFSGNVHFQGNVTPSRESQTFYLSSHSHPQGNVTL